MKKTLFILLVVSFLFPLFAIAENGSIEINRWDRLWADWDGIEPEVYIMMKDMDSLMTEMTRNASIAKNEKKETEFNDWLNNKVTDEILDLTNRFNPAVSPIKKMHDYAMQGTRGWLDWGMRKSVDFVYKKYAKELEKTNNIEQALANTGRWIREQQEIVMNNRIAKELEVIENSKELLFAYVIKTHKQFHPKIYQSLPSAGLTQNTTQKTVPSTIENNLELRVLDSKDKSPIDGAVVRLSGPSHYTGKSDNNGWARVKGLADGTYDIEVKAAGYQSVSGERSLSKNKTTRAKVLLRPDDGTPKKADSGSGAAPEKCYGAVGREIARLRAHNQSQNPQSGGVTVLTLDRDSSCMQQWRACMDQAKQTYDRCPPNSRGTYEDCIRANSQAWISCAMNELSCEESKAKAKCGL